MKTTLSWTRLCLCLFALSIAFYYPSNAQLVDLHAGLTPVGDASLGWADFDLDNDPDLLISGHTGSGPLTTLYRNTNGVFTNVQNMPFINISLGDVVWGDYDQDGDPDLLLTGEMANGVATTQMYRNNGNGTFTDLNAGVTAMEESMADWGDYDGDGDLDFFIAGAMRNGQSTTKIYRNNGNDTFTDIGAGLVGLRRGAGQWVDYDNDGDQDLVLTGRQTDNTRRTIIYQNTNGSFSDIGANLPNVDLSGIDWRDTNNNGYKELLMAGTSDAGPIAHVYKNPLETGNGFELKGAVEGVEFAAVEWVGSSLSEATVMGRNAGGATHTRRYSNIFLQEVPLGVQGLFKGDMEWVDVDGDGDEDLAVAGFDANDIPHARIYKSEDSSGNVAPSPTENLYAQVSGEDGMGLLDVKLEWIQALDAGIPNQQLTYNVRVGTYPGGANVLAPTTTGAGNNGQALARTLFDLVQQPGTYYWSVQTVDEQFARSDFAPEQAFKVGGVSFGLVFPNLRADGDEVEWGDLDNDGDLDVILVGSSKDGSVFLAINENTNGQFLERETGLPALAGGNVELADIDNDNDLDILLQGDSDAGTGIDQFAKIYRNDGDFAFTDIEVTLREFIALCAGSKRTWLDADNNGSVDVFSPALSFNVGFENVGLRRNDRGVFADFDEDWGFGGLCGTGTPGDLNNDSRTDMVLAGLETLAFRAGMVTLHQNEGDRFGLESTSFKGWSGTPAVGDYDSDGDLDVITAGAVYDRLTTTTGSLAYFSGVYRNNLQGEEIKGDQFSLAAQLLPLGEGRPAWGDYDVDGDLDLLLPNTTGSALWENRGGTFVNVLGVFVNSNGGFERLEVEHAAWGDYDGDGDLDILVSGFEDARPVTFIYRNNAGAENDEPHPPNTLSASASGASITFNWRAGSDEETATPALTYNLRVGTTPGGSEVFSAASLSDGTPLHVGYGNVYHNTSWTINDLEEGTYYWSVQSIDTGFRGSRFASEQSMTLGAPPSDPTDITFQASSVPFVAVSEAAAEWGDYNGDGLPDLIVTGMASFGPSTRLYRNTGEATLLVPVDYGFKDLDTGDVGWADYDRDGDLDLLISGRGSDGSFNTLLYRNTGSGFERVPTDLPGLFEGSIAWGDYDNDGDPDLLLTGMNASLHDITALYRNDNGSFTKIRTNMPGLRRGGIAWVDYEGDGDLDVFLTGRINNLAQLYRYENIGSDRFVTLEPRLPGVQLSSVDWADIDADGDPDVLLSGTTGSEKIARLYRRNVYDYTDLNVGLPGVEFSDAEFGDYDNDGDLDILLCGAKDGGRVGQIYQNNGGVYTSTNANLATVSKCAVVWADVNQDGYLDAFLSGELTASSNKAGLYLAVPGSRAPGNQNDNAAAEIHLDETPEPFALLANYPNPFNPSTRITYTLPEASDIRLTVYDLTGKQVAVLAEGYRDAGTHNAHFDASNLSSGMYLSRLETEREVVVLKMVLLR